MTQKGITIPASTNARTEFQINREVFISLTEDGRLYMVEDKLDQNLRSKRNADGRAEK